MAYKSERFFRALKDSGIVPLKLLEERRLHKKVQLDIG